MIISQRNFPDLSYIDRFLWMLNIKDLCTDRCLCLQRSADCWAVSHPMFGPWWGENLLCEHTSKRDSSVDMCRKVLLKALQGSTGLFTQMLRSLFLHVEDSLHVAYDMDRTSGHPDTTQKPGESTAFNNELYRDPEGQAVQQACLRVAHSPPSFHQHLSPCLPTTPASLNKSWTLKESGALCSLGQGQHSPSPLWKNLVKLILSYLQCETQRQHTASQISRHSPFNQKSKKQIFWTI